MTWLFGRKLFPKVKKGHYIVLVLYIGSKISLGYTIRSCTFAFKETHLEQELIKCQKEVKQQQAVNEEHD
jgi:hypothetical protein